MIRLRKLLKEIDTTIRPNDADPDELSFSNDDRTYIRGDKGQDLSDYNPMPGTNVPDHQSDTSDTNIKDRSIGEGMLNKSERPKDMPPELEEAYRLHDYAQNQLSERINTQIKDARPVQAFISGVRALARQIKRAYAEAVNEHVIKESLAVSSLARVDYYLKELQELEARLTDEDAGLCYGEADTNLYYLHTVLDSLASNYKSKEQTNKTKGSAYAQKKKMTEGFISGRERDELLKTAPADLQYAYRIHDDIQEFAGNIAPWRRDAKQPSILLNKLRNLANLTMDAFKMSKTDKLPIHRDINQRIVTTREALAKLKEELTDENSNVIVMRADDVLYQLHSILDVVLTAYTKRKKKIYDELDPDEVRFKINPKVEKMGDSRLTKHPEWANIHPSNRMGEATDPQTADIPMKQDKERRKFFEFVNKHKLFKEDGEDLSVVEPYDDADIEFQKHKNDDIENLPKDPDEVDIKMDPRVKRIGWGGLKGKYTPRSAGGFDNIAGGSEKGLGDSN